VQLTVFDQRNRFGIVDVQIRDDVVAVLPYVVGVPERCVFPVRDVDQAAVMGEVGYGGAVQRRDRVGFENLFGEPEFAADGAVGALVLKDTRAGEPRLDADAADRRALEPADPTKEVVALLVASIGPHNARGREQAPSMRDALAPLRFLVRLVAGDERVFVGRDQAQRNLVQDVVAINADRLVAACLVGAGARVPAHGHAADEAGLDALLDLADARVCAGRAERYLELETAVLGLNEVRAEAERCIE
jgi:hypothetical protein